MSGSEFHQEVLQGCLISILSDIVKTTKLSPRANYEIYNIIRLLVYPQQYTEVERLELGQKVSESIA